MFGVPVTFMSNQIFNPKSADQRAFTLVEIMVALSIFAIVALAVVNAFISIDRVNKKAQAMKTVIDNLHFALHGMAFNLKQGGDYHCFDGATVPDSGPSSLGAYQIPLDCHPGGDTAIAFTTPKVGNDSRLVIYRFNPTNNKIEYWKEEETESFTPLTVNSLVVEDMRFYVDQAQGTGLMPRVFVTFRGEAQAGQMVAELNLETVVSERL